MPDEPVAVVTGGSGGLGRAVCRALAGSGWRVVSCGSGRRAVGARSAAGEGDGADAELPPDVWHLAFDVTDSSAVRDAFDAVERRWGRIDLLVACAGITSERLLVSTSPAEWDRLIGVNLTGAFYCARSAARVMLRRRSGRIILVSSIAGLRGAAGLGAYAAAKAGLVGLGRSLAAELGGRGIQVNVVCPGMMPTRMGRSASAASWDRMRRESLLGRSQDPAEVAAFIVALCRMKNVSGGVFNLDSRLVPWG